ncbi:hypothetical protein KI387_009312, partial [Taxus chinensis]
VTTVEEENLMEWCDRCLFPHSPCEVNKEVEEDEYDDTDDDSCMMKNLTISQNKATLTELITARTT